jgi:hypothetical protein
MVDNRDGQAGSFATSLPALRNQGMIFSSWGEIDLTTITGTAGLVGGIFLLVKAIAILVTGKQPPLLFEIAPAFLAVALFGLTVAVVKPVGKRRLLIRVIIALVLAAAIGGLALDDEGGPVWEQVVSSLMDVVAGLGPLVLLVFLGFPVLRRHIWPGPWRILPLALGFGYIPAIAVGAVLGSAMGERYGEVSLVVIGVAWMLIGYRLFRKSRVSTS